MSCAKSVLPMFTGDSSEKLRIAPGQVQIDTTHFRPQAPAKSGVSRTRLAVNRTAVDLHQRMQQPDRVAEKLDFYPWAWRRMLRRGRLASYFERTIRPRSRTLRD